MLIGGNDIKAQSSPVDIARAIITLAKEIKESTNGEVRIVTIERRPGPRGVSQISYNRQRNSINRYLKHRDTFTRERIIFSEAGENDSQDGVHLRLRALEYLSWKILNHVEIFSAQNW